MVKERQIAREKAQGDFLFGRLLVKADLGYHPDDDDDFKWEDYETTGGPDKEKRLDLIKHGRMGRELFEKGSIKNWNGNSWADWTPFGWFLKNVNRDCIAAAINTDLELLTYCIKSGANLSFQDKDGNTAMHYAVMSCRDMDEHIEIGRDDLGILFDEAKVESGDIALEKCLAHPEDAKGRKHPEVVFDVFFEYLGRLQEKGVDISKEEFDAVTHEVSTAAMKYALLAVSCETIISFDIAKVTDFEDASAPFLLYNSTRLSSVIRKHEEGVRDGQAGFDALPALDQVDFSLLDDQRELQYPDPDLDGPKAFAEGVAPRWDHLNGEAKATDEELFEKFLDNCEAGLAAVAGSAQKARERGQTLLDVLMKIEEVADVEAEVLVKMMM